MSVALRAATPVDVVAVDLAPLIDQAAQSPTRFAVDVAHAVSPGAAGEWSRSGELSTWTYAVQIPGAVSMSFHASDASLPPSATLTVTADGTDYVYTAKDMRGGEFWSRIGRGDSLTFVLRVATEDVGRIRLDIASLQAGYRSVAGDTRSNPYYDGLRKHALATPPATCAENWTCDVTATNGGPGNATAAIVISNTALCTAVLLNDVPGDGAPYMLTARHCQNGSGDGGLPSAAGSIVVYWNAVSPCGSPLGSVFDPGTSVQYGGADTVVEQQDTWLVRLRQAPIVDAYYAGWDATGGAFIGGFTPHHASATARQFVGWYGQAIYFTLPPASLNLKYTSTFWGTVNLLGAGGPGSSGAGLFNDTGHLVGTVVRGVEAADGSGICPTNPPAVPSQATATSLSTALSGVWSSTADPGSSTGAATLQSVLDPGNTGTLVLDGQPRPITVTLSSWSSTPDTGTKVILNWSAPSPAVSCTASGGETGDGWPGAVTTTGSKQVTSFDGGDITYTITCTDDGQRTGVGSVTLHWALAVPSIYLDSSRTPDYGVPFSVSWNANVRPCSATGGTGGDGWAGSVGASGNASVTENVVGSVTYTLTCGGGARVVSQALTVDVQRPSLLIKADAVKLLPGQIVNITTSWHGAPCVRTGGSAGDGWAGTFPTQGSTQTFTLTESTEGTFTYAVLCGSGSYLASASVNVTFRNEPPAVTLHASSSSGNVGVDYIRVDWDANVRDCTLSVTSPNGAALTVPFGPHDSVDLVEDVIAQYTVAVTCGSGANSASASTALNWTGTPSVRLNAPTSVAGGAVFNVGYSTNVLPCTTSGGSAGDNWAGQFNEKSKTISLIERTAGPQTYVVTCGSGSQIATDQVSVTIVGDSPHVTLTADRTQQAFGQPITLTWNSNTSSCEAYTEFSLPDSWSGILAGSGSMTLTEQSGGGYVYHILCSNGSVAAEAKVIVAFGPGLTFTASDSTVAFGSPVTLTWTTSSADTCNATGGTAGSIWPGPLAPQGGSKAVTEAKEGTYVYTVTCFGRGTSTTASVSVAVSRAVTPPASSGGGGGGALGPIDLALFATLGAIGYWQRRRERVTLERRMLLLPLH